MNNILIHCAMEKEGQKIAKKLNLIQKEKNKIFNLYEGKEKETKIDLIITGIGKQKTAIGLSTYLCTYTKPKIIINIGYAGSTNEKIGTWININKSYNLEWDIPGEEKYSMEDLGNQELEKVDGLKRLPCYSSETFVTSSTIKDNVIFDMELHSICLLADLYNIPVLSLKKVSDNLNMEDYYKNIKKDEVMELESSVAYIKNILNKGAIKCI